MTVERLKEPEKLGKYIDEYVQIVGQLREVVGDQIDITSAANQILHERCKDKRQERMNEEESEPEDKEPTEKQMNYLGYLTDKLDEPMPSKKNLTRKDASELIDDYRRQLGLD